MFLAVIAAYVVATAFAFCGLARAVVCVLEADPGMGGFHLIDSLPQAMWPLGLAMVLVMLVQIATQLERARLQQAMIQPSRPAPRTTTTRSATKATPAPVSESFAPPRVQPEAAPAQEAPKPPAASPSSGTTPSSNGLNFFKLD